jgi:hypothetical protein
VQAFFKLLGREIAELRFGIVQVIDVDGIDAEIFPAAFDLVGEESRREHVTSGGDVLGADEAGRDVSALEIIRDVGGHFAIGREESALGADHDFIARKSAPREFFESRADGALAALEAIIDRGIQHVCAAFNRGDDGFGVSAVGCVVGLAEIGAEADRTEQKFLLRAKVACGRAACKPPCVALCSFRRCPAHVSSAQPTV